MCIAVMHIHQSAVLCHQAKCLLSMAEMSPYIILLLAVRSFTVVAAVVTMNTWMMTLTIQCIEYSLVYNEDALIPTTINTLSDLVSNPEQL